MGDRALKQIESVWDLNVFRKAYEISLEIHKVSEKFPQTEKYALTSQLRRSSKSVCANLMEGYAKKIFSSAEYKRYITIAIGSSEEVTLWLRYCLDLHYLSKKQYIIFFNEYKEVTRMLYGLHKSWK